MSQNSQQNSERRSLIRYACLAAAVTLMLLWALYLVRGPLLVIYVSALFATGLAPLVRIIERHRFVAVRKRLPRPAAILLIYGTVIGSLVGLGMAVIPPLIQQSREFWKRLPEYMDQAQQRLATWGLISPETSFKELLQQAPAGGGDAVSMVFGALSGFVGGIFGFVTILLLTFYMLVDSQRIFDFFVRVFPKGERNRVADVSELAAAKISAWLGGQMLLGLIIATISAIGYAVMGVPYFFVLAVIAGIGEMIPMVGPLLSAIPAVLVALTVSPGLALAVAAFCAVVQLIENNVLVPKVMGDTVGLSAVTVIASLIIGSELLGFVGALLAVPTAAIIQVLFEELYLAEKDAV
ncbi:MAG TPA: AI-2E family transporter [Vicinamibacterales bacterium]|nr:AI-2E family transporter [Vicinamibacterales bacterium]